MSSVAYCLSRSVTMECVDRTCDDEGFKAKPYPDPLSGGEPYTFGHGLTYITEKESRQIVISRLNELAAQLLVRFPWMGSQRLPQRIFEVIVEMAYQMGVEGVSGFTNMLAAAKRQDWKSMVAEMRDSHWHKETTHRSEELIQVVEEFIQ